MYVIIIFAILAVLLFNGKVMDILNIPRSKLSYAKVIAKENMRDFAGAYRYRNLTNSYKVTFEVDNSKTIIFPVSLKEYESLSDGSRGVLVYTNSRFRGFHTDKKIPDIEKKTRKNNLRRQKYYD